MALMKAFSALAEFLDTHVFAIWSQWALPTDSTTLFGTVAADRQGAVASAAAQPAWPPSAAVTQTSLD